MTSEERLSWISCYEALSNAIIPFSMRRLELIDILADALNESVLNFPIVESGEALEDMCPFTFFAGFNRQQGWKLHATKGASRGGVKQLLRDIVL